MQLAPFIQLGGNRPLAGLVVANGISSIGNWLYLTALPVLVYEETEDPALVGIVAAARLLPWLLLSMPAGAMTDRFPVARLLLATESIRAALMFLTTGLLLAGAPLCMVFGLALAAVVAGTFATPAHGTLIPQLARNDTELGTSNVVSSTLDNLACIIGPAIAGLLVVLGGLEFAFALNGLSFLVVVAVLVFFVAGVTPAIRTNDSASTDHDKGGSPLGRWISLARTSAPSLAIDGAISFTAGAMFIAPILIAAAQPGGGTSLVGVLSVSAGLGGLAGAIAAGPFVNGRSRQGLVGGVVVSVVSFALLAVSTQPLLAVAVVGLVCGAMVQLDTINMTELQRSTPADQLGRTLGLLHSLAAGWVMAGSLAMGFLADAAGIGIAMLTCAVIVAAVGALALIRVGQVVPAVLPARALPEA